MTFSINKALIILTDHGPDAIFLKTNLPSATWPYKGTQDLKFDCAAGDGADYVKRCFPTITDIEVVDLRRGKPDGE